MKVSKKTVVASDLLEGQELRTTEGSEGPIFTDIVDPKACAEQHIMAAIKCLSPLAKTDEVARECIANLAVIAFDLK